MPNPEVIKQSEESEEDRSFWKVLILAALGAASVFLSFFLFDKFLIEGNLTRALGSVFFAALFLSLFVLQVFLTKSRAKIALLSLLQAIAPLLLFIERIYPTPSLPLVLAFAAFFLFLVAAAARGEREISNSMTIRFFAVAKSIVGRAVAGLLIVFSVLLYLTYFVWGGFNESFSKRLTDQTLAASEPLIGTFLVEVSFGDTVSDFFRTLAENELRKIKVGPEGESAIEFQRLPPKEQERIIGEISLEFEKQAEKIAGPLNASATVKDEVFRVIKDYVEEMPAATKSVLSVGLAVLFFFSARGIAFLFYWLPEFIAFIIFKIFLVTGFAYVSLESRSREFIMLS